MRNNNSGTGLAALIVLGLFLVIGWFGNAMEPKCIKSGCDNSRADGSRYCYLHKGSSYGHTYRYPGSSTGSASSSSSSSSASSSSSTGSASSSSSTGSASSSSSTNKSAAGSKKSNQESSGWDSYDEGYDDIYMDGDYDYDRYDSDDDYASGVDDAMEEAWEEYGGRW